MQASGSRGFGVLAAGVPLLLPQGEPLEYLADAVVHWLPGAGERVAGLLQLRGVPIVVLDPAAAPARAAPARRRLGVLVIGHAPEGAALVVDGPPAPLETFPARAASQRPDCAFAAALGEPVAEAADPGRLWWGFDARRLFAALAST